MFRNKARQGRAEMMLDRCVRPRIGVHRGFLPASRLNCRIMQPAREFPYRCVIILAAACSIRSLAYSHLLACYSGASGREFPPGGARTSGLATEIANLAVCLTGWIGVVLAQLWTLRNSGTRALRRLGTFDNYKMQIMMRQSRKDRSDCRGVETDGWN